MPSPKPSDAPLRERIVQLALATVREGGVASLTMRGLARQLGYSPATLYLHFRGKEELLREVAAGALRELSARADAGPAGDDPLAALRRLSGAVVGFARECPELDALAFDAGGAGPVAALRAELFARVERAVGEGIARGALRGGEPGLAAALYWAQLRGLAHIARGGRPPPVEVRATAHLTPAALVEAGLALWRP